MSSLTNNQRKVLESFRWLFSAYVYRFFIGYLSLSFVARYLGPEQYGTLSYVISAYSLFEIFLQAINQEILKKEFIENPDKGTVLRSSLTFHFLLSITLLVLLSIFLPLFNFTSQKLALFLVISLTLLFRVSDVLECFFSAEMKNKYVAKTEMWVVTIFNSSRILLAILKLPLISFAFAILLQKALNLVFVTYYFTKNYSLNLSQKTFDGKLIKRLLIQSLPAFASVASITLFSRIDNVMLGNLMSDSAVGIYSIVVKLFEPWSFVAVIVCQTIFPILVSSHKSSRDDFIRKSTKTFCMLFYSAVGIIIGTLLFSDIIVRALFSDQFILAASIVKIHILSLIFMFWLVMTTRYEVVISKVKYTLYKTIFTSLINIILNYFLIKKFGIWGASYATMFSYFLAAFALNIFFKELRPMLMIQLKSLLFWKIRWL